MWSDIGTQRGIDPATAPRPDRLAVCCPGGSANNNSNDDEDDDDDDDERKEWYPDRVMERLRAHVRSTVVSIHGGLPAYAVAVVAQVRASENRWPRLLR
jgi:hypothetical protein